jgi:predicted MPP superfamily phosphohydrolase
VRRISRRKFLAGLASTPFLATGHAALLEPTWLKIKQIRLSERPRHRFVQVTDIHHKGDRKYLEKVVRAINAQKPDFVCFTGDLIEDAHFAPEALRILCGVKAPLYGIPGNHDYWADMDFDAAKEAFAGTGGKWLMDEDVTIREGELRLIGVCGNNAGSFSARAGVKNILLSHYPNGVDLFHNTKFDLILAGHSHGGQVRLPWYGALVVPFGVGEYQLGMYQTHAGPLYVSAGIGYFFMNVRFCCRPEISVFEI